MDKHIVIVAGEESGDMHAAALIKQLKVKSPTLKVTGIGGKHMQAVGAELISDLARYGVTGLSEVFKHFLVIKKAYRNLQQHLRDTPPDLLILVDYPGFNLRLAKYAKQVLGLRILYYISPQIWAWKPNRIHTIKACVDRMAVILPFEKAIYAQAGVPVSFVGHPLVETTKPSADVTTLRNQFNLPLNKRIIALLPGSRMHEIERHMPVLYDTINHLCKRFADLHFVIPVASTINPEKIHAYLINRDLPVTCVSGKAIDVVSCSDFVVVASGTASLECALLEKPMCIIYKASKLTYAIATQVIRIKYIGLSNVLTNSMMVPEFLQEDCNAKNLTVYLTGLIKDEQQVNSMVNRLVALKNKLSSEVADCSVSDLVEREIIASF